MTDLILVIILVAVIGTAVLYIRKEKKRGVKCIGCPSSGSCVRKQKKASECSCGCHIEVE